MRKRMIGILLALMIVTGLAACGNTEASETENTRQTIRKVRRQGKY